MISLYLTVLRLLKATIRSIGDEEFRALALVTLVLLLSGSWFYTYAENWSLLDSVYFCVMTMTTIGYGDFIPTTDLSKVFTIVYSFVSIGVFVSLAAKLATGMMKHHKSASGSTDHRHKSTQ